MTETEWSELKSRFKSTVNEPDVRIESSAKAASSQLTLNLNDGMAIGMRDGAK